MRDPIVIALNEVRRHDIAAVDGKEVCCSCGSVVPYGKHDADVALIRGGAA